MNEWELKTVDEKQESLFDYMSKNIVEIADKIRSDEITLVYKNRKFHWKREDELKKL